MATTSKVERICKTKSFVDSALPTHSPRSAVDFVFLLIVRYLKRRLRINTSAIKLRMALVRWIALAPPLQKEEDSTNDEGDRNHYADNNASYRAC